MTSSQPPHSKAKARTRDVRAARLDTQSSAASESSAAGISQDTCPPNSDWNSRKMPVAPPNLVPVVPPPPIDPVSDPSSRPSPL